MTEDKIEDYILGFQAGKSEALKEVEKFLKERTYQTNELPALIKFMPFEWEDFKKNLNIT